MIDIRKTHQRARSAARSGSLVSQISFMKLQHTNNLGSSSGFEVYRANSRAVPPVVTATSWSIHDANTGSILWEKRADEQREMASLTKIMTCYLSCQLLTRFNEDPEKLTFTVQRSAARIFGTHAGLRENDVVRVIDLLYGLMLPSGNDAAIALAHGFGSLLLKTKKSRVIDKVPMSPIQEFVKEMNKTSQNLYLRSTCYTNPHGLAEKGNKSTVSDLGKLAFHAMEMPLIQKIASTQAYEATVTNAQEEVRVLNWKNTNKLLEKGFLGLKTGTTPTAGLCLSSVLKQGEDGVIVTLLGAKTDNHRFQESEKLARWGLETIISMKKHIDGVSDSRRSKLTTKMIAEISKSF